MAFSSESTQLPPLPQNPGAPTPNPKPAVFLFDEEAIQTYKAESSLNPPTASSCEDIKEVVRNINKFGFEDDTDDLIDILTNTPSYACFLDNYMSANQYLDILFNADTTPELLKTIFKSIDSPNQEIARDQAYKVRFLHDILEYMFWGNHTEDGANISSSLAHNTKNINCIKEVYSYALENNLISEVIINRDFKGEVSFNQYFRDKFGSCLADKFSGPPKANTLLENSAAAAHTVAAPEVVTPQSPR